MEKEGDKLVLVARKSAFGLTTACPDCLSVHVCLKLSKTPFDIHYNLINPDSEALPAIEYGEYAAFENENNGIIDFLIKKELVTIDSRISGEVYPEWMAFRSMVRSCLHEAALYELWIASDASVAHQIYFSDLPWPINRILHWKQKRSVMQRLGIDFDNAQTREDQIYKNAELAYEAIAEKLQYQTCLLLNEPTTLDAILLGNILFVLHTFDDSSSLKQIVKRYDHLVKYADNLKSNFMEASSSSNVHEAFSMFNRSSTKSTKKKDTKQNANKERSEKQKTFKRRSKYFLMTQCVAVIAFLALMGTLSETELEMEDDEGLMSDD